MKDYIEEKEISEIIVESLEGEFLTNNISKISFLFVAFLIIAGGYATQIFSCSTQRYLSNDISSFIGGKETGILVTDDPLECILKSDAIIDFSFPSSTIEICELVAQARKVHVIGTTGFNVGEEEKIKARKSTS